MTVDDYVIGKGVQRVHPHPLTVQAVKVQFLLTNDLKNMNW